MSVGYATVIDDISLIVREFEGMSTDFCTLTSTITSVSTLCRAAIGEQIGEKAFKDKCRTIVAGYSGVARDSCKIGVFDCDGSRPSIPCTRPILSGSDEIGKHRTRLSERVLYLGCNLRIGDRLAQ